MALFTPELFVQYVAKMGKASDEKSGYKHFDKILWGIRKFITSFLCVVLSQNFGLTRKSTWRIEYTLSRSTLFSPRIFVTLVNGAYFHVYL